MIGSRGKAAAVDVADHIDLPVRVEARYRARGGAQADVLVIRRPASAGPWRRIAVQVGTLGHTRHARRKHVVGMAEGVSPTAPTDGEPSA